VKNHFYLIFPEEAQEQPTLPPQAPIIPGLNTALQDFATAPEENFDAAEFLEVPPNMSPVTAPFSLDDIIEPYEHELGLTNFERVSNAITVPSTSNPNSFYEIAVLACLPYM
jgi:hypothetical protein